MLTKAEPEKTKRYVIGKGVVGVGGGFDSTHIKQLLFSQHGEGNLQYATVCYTHTMLITTSDKG